uniref:Uncharacterized protein n=1 Tax=Arundo donax TaxID=35708 RepID=A0A0A8Z574_ARUDO
MVKSTKQTLLFGKAEFLTLIFLDSCYLNSNKINRLFQNMKMGKGYWGAYKSTNVWSEIKWE